MAVVKAWVGKPGTRRMGLRWTGTRNRHLSETNPGILVLLVQKETSGPRGAKIALFLCLRPTPIPGYIDS
jgi:hypothetical protein